MVGSEASSVIRRMTECLFIQRRLYFGGFLGVSNIPTLHHMQIAAFHRSVYPASLPSTHCVV